jgi:hypothetical protein
LLQVYDVVRDRERVVAALVSGLGDRGELVDGLEGNTDRETHEPRLERVLVSRSKPRRSWLIGGVTG